MLGVSRQTVNAYENNRQRPTLDMLERISSKQSISPQWLLTGLGDPRDESDYVPPEESPRTLPISEDSLAPEQRALVDFITADPQRAVRLARLLWDQALGQPQIVTEDQPETSRELLPVI